MMQKKNRYLTFILLTTCLLACSEFEFPEVIDDPISGDVDFSNIVFLGGSRFAELEDGALSARGHQFSIPNLFLKELGFVDETEIITPFVNSENGYNIYEDQTTLTAGSYSVFFPTDDTLFFKREVRLGTQLSYANADNESLNSYSFPQSGILDITETSRGTNPYISGFFGNSNALLDRVAAANPSLFILDLGFQDLLNFATNGATGNPNSSDINTTTNQDLLSNDAFRLQLQRVVDLLLSGNPESKGLLLNIPDFIDFPYFSQASPLINGHVAAKPSIRTNAFASASVFNQNIIDYYNQNPNPPPGERRPLLDYAGQVNTDQWGLLVLDNSLSDISLNGNTIPKIRQMSLSEFVFYKDEQQLWSGLGSLVENPILPDGYLSLDNAEFIRQKVSEYNAVISEVVANANGRLAIVDSHGLFQRMFEGYGRLLGNPPEGINIAGVRYEPFISRDGIFSADGLNLNPVGKAIITNEIISVINRQFDGNLQSVDPNNVPKTSFGIGN